MRREWLAFVCSIYTTRIPKLKQQHYANGRTAKATTQQHTGCCSFRRKNEGSSLGTHLYNHKFPHVAVGIQIRSEPATGGRPSFHVELAVDKVPDHRGGVQLCTWIQQTPPPPPPPHRTYECQCTERVTSKRGVHGMAHSRYALARWSEGWVPPSIALSSPTRSCKCVIPVVRSASAVDTHTRTQPSPRQDIERAYFVCRSSSCDSASHTYTHTYTHIKRSSLSEPRSPMCCSISWAAVAGATCHDTCHDAITKRSLSHNARGLVTCVCMCVCVCVCREEQCHQLPSPGGQLSSFLPNV